MSDAPLVATPSQTVGPFFHFGLAASPSLGRLAGPGAKGDRIALRVRVYDGDGVPVPDALVEIWQADADGAVTAGPPPADASFSGFGRLATSDEGSCEFETVRPGRMPDGQGGRQASHVNVCFFARGLLRHIHTRIYFAADPSLAEDAALALVPASRRETLLAHRDPGDPSRWIFDLRLQGERETVFFDL
jgi:protocatechuate 3,4-dioxygenase alpha subunit